MEKENSQQPQSHAEELEEKEAVLQMMENQACGFTNGVWLKKAMVFMAEDRTWNALMIDFLQVGA